MTEIQPDENKAIIESATDLAEDVVTTLHPGDEITIFFFDNRPYEPLTVKVTTETDKQRALDYLTQAYVKEGASARVLHPERRGTNIRWAHHEVLKAMFAAKNQGKKPYCVFITDGHDDGVPGQDFRFDKDAAVALEGYKKYYLAGSNNLPNTPESTEYQQFLKEAAPWTQDAFIGFGVKFTPRPELTPNQAVPVKPRSAWERLPLWTKSLLMVLSLLIAFIVARSATRKRTVELELEHVGGILGHDCPSYPMKPLNRWMNSVTIGGSSSNGYNLPLRGTNEVVARVVAKPFGKFVLVPTAAPRPDSDAPTIQIQVGSKYLKRGAITLANGSRIRISVRDAQMQHGVSTENVILFSVK